MKTTCPHCGHKFEPNPFEIDREDLKWVAKYMNDCDEKFKEEHPCPKCGSHNVDIDLGTPMWCNDCGYRWG
jgi:Zn finger protein HypA/HybF involved in hydrogenase expression